MSRREGAPKAGGGGWKAGIPCKSGDGCKTLSCPFAHSQAACKKGDKCIIAGCVFRHPWARKRVCSSGEGCRIFTCAFLHPPNREVCSYGERCTNHACTRMHSKERMVCRAECKVLACTAVHPRGRIASCPLGELCVALACRNQHPPSRAPPREALEGCADGVCSGLELVLSATECPPEAMEVRARVLSSRRAHEAKLAAARSQVFTLHLQGGGVGEEQGLALVRELSEQLESFDATVSPIWASLCDQASASASPAQRGGGAAGGVGEMHQRVLREVLRLEEALPVLCARARLEALVSSSEGRFLVVTGAPGTGKSSQLPGYLADMPMFAGRKIIVTQPRNGAAMALAARVALAWSGGQQGGCGAVGFRAGGASSPGARIEFVTEAAFLAQLVRESKWGDGVGAVVVDDAHERSVRSDLILGALRSLPGLQHLTVVVSSASTDAARVISTFLGAPVMDVPSRVFPVEVVYRPSSDPPRHDPDTVSKVVAMALEIHAGPRASGDVLAFLPGSADVLRACAMFERAADEGSALTLPLFDKQDPGEQARVFAPSRIRKVVFATRVADMSLSFDGVRHVIDAGVCNDSAAPTAPPAGASGHAKATGPRVTGGESLVRRMRPISKHAAEQRTGRAGRGAAGTCYRLYSEEEHALMEQRSVAEVHRVPLALAVTTILALGIAPAAFAWPEPPGGGAVGAALTDLALLGAVEGDPRTRTLMPLGDVIAALQVEPEHARLLLHACRVGRGDVGATLVALLSVSAILFCRGASEEGTVSAAAQHAALAVEGEGDVVTMFRAFQSWEQAALLGGEDAEEAGVPAVRQDAASASGRQDTSASSGRQDPSVSAPEAGGEGVTPASDRALPADAPAFAPAGGDGAPRLGSQGADDEEAAGNAGSGGGSRGDGVGQNMGGSVGSGPEGVSAAEAWCRRFFLNHTAMRLADGTRRDLATSLNRLGLWDNTQQGRCSNREIRRLVAKGYFLNAAVHVPARDEFVLVRASGSSMAVIHPASSLRSPPPVLVYRSTMHTTRTVMSTVTPVDAGWIEEENGAYFRQMQERVAAVRSHRISIRGLTVYTSMALLGRGFSDVPALEARLKCSLEADLQRRVLTAWAHPDDARGVEAELTRLVREVREGALEQVSEESLLGGVRAVFGRGAEVQGVLFGQAHTSVVVNGLPRELSALALRRIAETCGRVRNCEVRACTREEGAWGRVVYFDADDAASAVEGLPLAALVALVGGAALELKARPGGRMPAMVLADTTTELVMTWALAESSGTAHVEFGTACEANAALLAFGGAANGMKIFPVDGGALGDKLGAANVPRVLDGWFVEPKKEDAGARYRLKLTCVPAQMVEEEISLLFQRWGTRPASCCVKRVLREGGVRDSASGHVQDSASLSAELIAEIPLYSRLVGTTPFTHPVQRRAGVRLAYESDDACELAAMEWQQRVWDKATPVRNGQEIQLEVIYRAVLAMPSSVCAGLKRRLDPVVRAAVARGVVVSRRVDGARTVLHLQAASHALLRTVKARVDEELRCVVFEGAGKHLLFTNRGRRSLEGLAAAPALVLCEASTRMVRVFGPASARQAVLASLVALGLSLQAALVTRRFRVRVECRREVRLAVARLGSAEEVEGVRLGGVMLEAVGTASAIEGLALEVAVWLADGAGDGGGDGGEEVVCSLCFCQADDAFELVACGHVFCRECIAGQFYGAHLQMEAPPLPLTCTAAGCGVEVAWGDVEALASPEALAFLRRCAVVSFVLASNGELRMCPLPGCGQVLSVRVGAGAGGAGVGECDQCLRTYCMVCSDREGAPVDGHAGETCADVVSGGSTDVRQHVDYVLDRILTLHCPKCGMAFLDYEGCFALACRSASCCAGFCACCLKDCGKDAHAHVRECDKNPRKGEYFGSMADFTAIHCARRKCEVEAYLDTIVSSDMRRQVRKLCLPHLLELNIDLA